MAQSDLLKFSHGAQGLHASTLKLGTVTTRSKCMGRTGADVKRYGICSGLRRPLYYSVIASLHDVLARRRGVRIKFNEE